MPGFLSPEQTFHPYGLVQRQSVNIILLPVNTAQPIPFQHSCDSDVTFLPLPAEMSSKFVILGSRPGTHAMLETFSSAGTLGFFVQLSGVCSLPPPNFHFQFFICEVQSVHSTNQSYRNIPLIRNNYSQDTIPNYNVINQWQIPALTLLAHCTMLACWLMALTLRAISVQL